MPVKCSVENKFTIRLLAKETKWTGECTKTSFSVLKILILKYGFWPSNVPGTSEKRAPRRHPHSSLSFIYSYHFGCCFFASLLLFSVAKGMQNSL